MRLLLEDFAHYATLRKPRRGEDATLVFDEFSAIAGGREAAIQLVERVRDAGCALYLSAQSADGLGDEAQQRRLVGACSGGLLHAMPDPDTLLRAAGVVKVVEQTWRLDPQGPTGNSSARIGERPRIEPTAVQQAREGEAWYIARGRYEHLMVARTTDRADWASAGRASAAAGRGRGRPRRRPGGHRHPGPPGPRPRRRHRRAGCGGRGPLAQAPPPPSRLAGRPALERGPPAAAAPASRPGGAGRTGAAAMTDQISRAQRRRTTRSTTISTATSAAIQTSTQIHSGPGMAGLLPSGSVAERDGVTAAIGWLRARNDVHASLPCGDPDRLRRPRTSRPFACWTGCHLAASAVKGRCALLSARSACSRPLTAPASTRPGDTGRPGRARNQCPTSRQEAQTVADHPWDPHPSRHLLTPQPGRRTRHPSGPPSRPRSQHHP
jgi:hypothetical protein